MDTLDALRLFVKVAEVGSFSAVARGRALAVSTVTLAVQQLEQQMGSPLLQRSTRKVSLTEEGQLFYQHAQTLLQQWQHTVETLQPQPTLRGDIHLAVPSVFARQTLLPIIDGFMALHPDIAMHVLKRPRSHAPTSTLGCGHHDGAFARFELARQTFAYRPPARVRQSTVLAAAWHTQPAARLG